MNFNDVAILKSFDSTTSWENGAGGDGGENDAAYVKNQSLHFHWGRDLIT